MHLQPDHMEQARVVIIGGGPAGLVLALTLAQHKVKSIILEKEIHITQDPRGVYLAGDAVRILWDIGLGEDMPIIGHELESVHFHSSSFANTPFHTVDNHRDSLQQAVPTGILQIQPALERCLRKNVTASEFCDLRTGCNVLTLEENMSGVIINYNDPNGLTKSLHTVWLIGADGKRGVVRKTFLQPLADIRQVHSDYRYEGTWVAANLRISVPTEASHPEFPAWKLGMTPGEVYDLFWPKGWHFCCPPGKPTAAGRFGPHSHRLWRHEFRQDEWDEKTMDAEELLWEHLTPMITRTENVNGRCFPSTTVYPRDCIQIMRCKPFTFAHKVVNRWFYRRSILIGDAAHVFPPFGGQGIASGIRDAHQLGWRISMLENCQFATEKQVERVLNDWVSERTLSVQNAAHLTKINGTLCNSNNITLFRITQLIEWARIHIFRGEAYDPQTLAEQRGLRPVTGFFLKDHGGGVRLPQIYLNTLFERRILSDSIFGPMDTPLRLLVIVKAIENPTAGIKQLSGLLSKTEVSPNLLSPDSIVLISLQPCQPESIGYFATSNTRKVSPTPFNQLSKRQARPGYDAAAFETRLGSNTRYAIVRSDFFVFAAARDLGELELCLVGLREKVS